jgi:Domain of unknown function (DUF6851)
VQARADHRRGGGRAHGQLRRSGPGPDRRAARPDDPAPLYTINGLAPTKGDNVILRWDEELLQAIRANPAGTGPTITARALGVAHTSMFDAWAAYDARANGTRYGGKLRRPAPERTLENKNKAISFAAYTTLVDLFPSRADDFALQMKELGYPVDGSDTSTPAKIGLTVAQAAIAFRHKTAPTSSAATPTPPATSRSTPRTRSWTAGAGSRCGCRWATPTGPCSGPSPPSGSR